jgi:hypothetical protein
MCLASATGPSSQFWPDAEAVVSSLLLTRSPAWQVAQFCISIALLFLALKTNKETKATDSKDTKFSLQKQGCKNADCAQ